MRHSDRCQRVKWHNAAARLLAKTTVLLALSSSAQAQTETVEYYGADAIGSVRVVYDGGGNEIGRTDYLPLGEELTAAQGLPAEHSTGQARDPEADLDYFNARMYQPRGGRLLTTDPVGGDPFEPLSWNRYALVRNSPAVYVDPTGAVACMATTGAKYCPGFTGPYNGGELDLWLQRYDQQQRVDFWETAADAPEGVAPATVEIQRRLS